ncbi:MAG TPA: Ig-like domain-containing protein, partial [Acidobacteriota bacterium]
EVPQRTAAVTYTPNGGYLGADSFAFEVCGTISATLVCDTGTVSITVVDVNATAFPQTVSTASNEPITVTLVGQAGFGGGARSLSRTIIGRAAFIDGAEIAGNTADADNNGFGDNHNDLPGPAPVLMSAGVDQAGGAGSNGVVRMQIEWDVSGLKSLAGSLESADVILHTNKGTVDSLDTFFYLGSFDQDLLLTDSDFEAPATQIPGVVMPVPAVPSGTDGTFSFDVEGLLNGVLLDDTRDSFSIQGRVNESLVGGGAMRGLQVRTTATSNVADFMEPQLSITTPGVFAPLVFSIVSLPVNGTLRDSFNNPITTVPTALPNRQVTYISNLGFNGTDSFQFQVDDGFSLASATITLLVGSSGPCIDGVDPDGRPCDGE